MVQIMMRPMHREKTTAGHIATVEGYLCAKPQLGTPRFSSIVAVAQNLDWSERPPGT